MSVKDVLDVLGDIRARGNDKLEERRMREKVSGVKSVGP